jgi:hypothetical protein
VNYPSQNEIYSSLHWQNAFTDKLGPLGFDIHSVMVVDLLHKFELGVWKSLFTHLTQILDAVDKKALVELDTRYDTRFFC